MKRGLEQPDSPSRLDSVFDLDQINAVSVQEVAGFVIAGIVMLIGLIGTCVPGIPGAPLILAAAVAHKLMFGDRSASYFALALLAFLTVLSLVLDFLGSLLGAKKLGATWRGMLGAMLGGIVGLFFSLPGLILGPIIGAFVFEFASGRAWKESAQAGAGAMIGLVLGALGKVICCVIMVGVFFLSSFYSIWETHSTTTTVVAFHGQSEDPAGAENSQFIRHAVPEIPWLTAGFEAANAQAAR